MADRYHQLSPRRPHRMTVGDVMTKDVITVAPEAPVKEVGGLLRQHRVSGLPVVDAGGNLVGVVTEADLLYGKEAASGERLEHPMAFRRERRGRSKGQARTAAQAMSSPPQVITANAPLAAAARSLRKHGIRRLPVVDDQGRVVGIVSRRDILVALARPDEEIRRDVVEGFLDHWLWIDPEQVQVKVEEGVVTLTGVLESRSDTEILVHLVGGLDGVVGVNSTLSFQYDDHKLRPPSDRQFEWGEARGGELGR